MSTQFDEFFLVIYGTKLKLNFTYGSIRLIVIAHTQMNAIIFFQSKILEQHCKLFRQDFKIWGVQSFAIDPIMEPNPVSSLFDVFSDNIAQGVVVRGFDRFWGPNVVDRGYK